MNWLERAIKEKPGKVEIRLACSVPVTYVKVINAPSYEHYANLQEEQKN